MEEKLEKYKDVYKQIVGFEANLPDLPILYNVNVGHAYPIAVWWWLRSLTADGTQASFVNFDGKCHENYVGNTYLSVRPALWLNLEAYNSLQTLE